MDLTLTAKMRPDLKIRKNRMWKDDSRTGEMHLRFFNFFAVVKPGSKQTELLKALLDEYFMSRCDAEVTIDDYFERSIQHIKEKKEENKNDKNKLLDWELYEKNLLTNRKAFESLRLSGKKDKNSPSKVIEYMNKYTPKYDKYFFRFPYKGALVLMDVMKVIFIYETDAEGLLVKQYPGGKAWDDMYENLQDIELVYKCSVKKLRTLGKDGFIAYEGREFRLLPYCKFLNPDETVEFGSWKNDKGGVFLFLNQKDRYMSVCPENSDNSDGFVFKLEEFADVI